MSKDRKKLYTKLKAKALKDYYISLLMTAKWETMPVELLEEICIQANLVKSAAQGGLPRTI